MTVNAPTLDHSLGNAASEPPMSPAPHRRTWLRYVVVAVGVLALVGLLGGIKAAQIGKLMGMGKAFMAAGPPPESVTTAVAGEQTWESTLSSVASLVSAKGVSVSADASGTVMKIHFDSGASVKQGQVLVELDTSVERAQLASVQARRDLAQAQMKRSSSLVSSGVISQSQAESDEATFNSLVAEARARQ